MVKYAESLYDCKLTVFLAYTRAKYVLLSMRLRFMAKALSARPRGVLA
jgi:hypothetical protein